MRALLWIFLSLFTLTSRADCLSTARLTGVNLAGAEFNASKLPGRINFDFVYPSSSTMDYFVGKQANIFRLPITWERMQPTKFADLDQTNLNELLRVAQYAKNHGLCLLVDLHNFGNYSGHALSSYSDASDMLTDIWFKLSTALSAYKANVALGLMNEPASVTRTFWYSLSQTVVTRLRNQGVTNLILVSGGNWSGAHSWFSGTQTDDSNANLFRSFSDPLDRTLIELHQYADSDYSGTHTSCISTDQVRQFLNDVTNWGIQNNQKLFLGEFGVSTDSNCLTVLQDMLANMQGTSWAGWTYWAAGAWWGNYPFSIQPNTGNTDKPQMTVLSPYLAQ